MSRQFNRAQREYKSNIHPRLDQLNRELYVERTKTFDHVFATGKGMRIPCCVMVDIDMNCFATAQFAGRAWKESGTSPAGAFLRLLIRLTTRFMQLPYEERKRAQAEFGSVDH